MREGLVHQRTHCCIPFFNIFLRSSVWKNAWEEAKRTDEVMMHLTFFAVVDGTRRLGQGYGRVPQADALANARPDDRIESVTSQEAHHQDREGGKHENQRENLRQRRQGTAGSCGPHVQTVYRARLNFSFCLQRACHPCFSRFRILSSFEPLTTVELHQPAFFFVASEVSFCSLRTATAVDRQHEDGQALPLCRGRAISNHRSRTDMAPRRH